LNNFFNNGAKNIGLAVNISPIMLSRPGRSTVDAIFIIHEIISNILQNKFKLYSAFVNFRKAFDKLNRRILIYKLLRNGLSTKFVAMEKSIYSSVRLRVKAGGVLSDAFDSPKVRVYPMVKYIVE
jgi:hypothetical protein